MEGDRNKSAIVWLAGHEIKNSCEPMGLKVDQRTPDTLPHCLRSRGLLLEVVAYESDLIKNALYQGTYLIETVTASIMYFMKDKIDVTTHPKRCVSAMTRSDRIQMTIAQN